MCSKFLARLLLTLYLCNSLPLHAQSLTQRLERLLSENILPFWGSEILDNDLGGYRLNHDTTGEFLGDGPKGIVTQARTLWFFSRLFRSPHGQSSHLQVARHGFAFLQRRLWDPEFGGFYWSVDSSGMEVLRSEKHLYGQAFALYALSEYYLASRDSDALHLARELFSLLEFRAHDRLSGGYLECFSRDWTPLGEGQNGAMGYPFHLKLMNTHLHLMEAFTTYLRASRDALARERLIELIRIESNTVVRKSAGACTDRYTSDWRPLTGPEHDIVSYGHDIENVWLIMDACEAAGINDQPLFDLYQTLFDYSSRFGFDYEQGGFFHTGKIGHPAGDKRKVWWVQAEALISSLMMWKRSGQVKHYRLFEMTLEWIEKHQADWNDGEWYAIIEPDGVRSGAKAGLWKSPYHNGRAVLECLELLRKNTPIGPAGSPSSRVVPGGTERPGSEPSQDH